MANTERLHEVAQMLRVDAVRASEAAGSGHPTSSLSAADLMAVLIEDHLRYDFSDPGNPCRDELIFSKGHASPLLYAIYRAVGAIDEDELLTFRKHGSRLEGHPTPALPWVDVATGSLGQGLPAGVGVALAGKYLDRLPYRVWVLCGDSELAEGSMWEAFEHAGHYELDNMVAIVDVNRLGQRGPTMLGRDLDGYRRRAEAFGWRALTIDGHDLEAIDAAYRDAERGGAPLAIFANTIKGKGVAAVEDKNGYHGTPLPDAAAAIEELGGVRSLRVDVRMPDGAAARHRFEASPADWPRYEKGDEVATRLAYGEALAALGSERPQVVALDAEVSNSTRADRFAEAHPERFFEMYISEQQMIAAAVGLQTRGWLPFASTFAAFHTRAFDFVRMAAVGRANLKLCGSHAGVSIGEDGPSQMGLQDLAMFRAVHGSTVLYPCDANQAAALVRCMAETEGIAYLRTTREATPVIYDPDDHFAVGGSRTLRSSDADDITIAAAGVTVREALRAADELASQGISARVLDLYSVKPLDGDALERAAAETRAIVTVEDHWAEGGLGEAVLAALSEAPSRPPVRVLAVRELPGSASPEEQRADARIDCEAIARAAREVLEL